jgi:hypothetical protein
LENIKRYFLEPLPAATGNASRRACAFSVTPPGPPCRCCPEWPIVLFQQYVDTALVHDAMTT